MRSKKAPRPRHGFCKLTHKPGRFVDSHIIPEALTRPTRRGNGLVQYGQSQRPSKRWTSWYDPELVIREGEDYLSALDTWAIEALRTHKLVWSGWGEAKTLGEHHEMYAHPFGVRSVELDTARLRRFFLSLLWRAAASTRPECAEIVVPLADLEQLRRAVLGEIDPPLNFYPAQLTQLSTRGLMHNQAPHRATQDVPNLDAPDEPWTTRPTFRFYMDGLIAHMFADARPVEYVGDVGNLIVGAAPTLLVSTVTFEHSLQAREMMAILGEYHAMGYDP